MNKPDISNWRVILVNADSSAAKFYTIQFKCYAVLDYRNVKDIQLKLKNIFDQSMLHARGITNIIFADWQNCYYDPKTITND